MNKKRNGNLNWLLVVYFVSFVLSLVKGICVAEVWRKFLLLPFFSSILASLSQYNILLYPLLLCPLNSRFLVRYAIVLSVSRLYSSPRPCPTIHGKSWCVSGFDYFPPSFLSTIWRLFKAYLRSEMSDFWQKRIDWARSRLESASYGSWGRGKRLARA